MRAALILNPTSGVSFLSSAHQSPADQEQRILDILRGYNIEAEVQHTTPEDTGQALAKRAAMNHIELVIVAGGDGTIDAVASGLIGTQSILGILPMGTMNNLAHSLHIPSDLETACAIIGHGATQSIDAGVINNHPFIEVAGVGLEAALFPAAEVIKRPGFISTIQGVIQGLIALFAYRPTRLKIAFNGRKQHSYHAIQVTVCNSPFYGAHLQAAPDATMNDGLLDVIIYRTFSKLAYLRHAISISQGRRVLEPQIRHLRVRSLRISAHQPVEAQADGQALSFTPVEIRVIPGAVRVRVPDTNAPDLLQQQENRHVSEPSCATA